MPADAILFDLDGTLVDSNTLHVEAWCDAFEELHYRVAADRVEVEIGKGGDHLVADVLGKSADRADGDAIRAAHDRAFARLAVARPIAAAPDAVALLQALRARGVRVALATSSGRDQIAFVERSSGVPWRSLFDVVADGDAVAASKPSPDVVVRAVELLGVTPAQCAMIGDSIWDAEAAARAGVAFVGVTMGGNDARSLARTGARAVHHDVAEIRRRLDHVLRRVSPQRVRLDRAALEHLVGEAIAVAEEGMQAGEAPIGAVCARGDGGIVGRGHNRAIASGNRAEHAELVAFRAAASALPAGTDDAILVSTLEPCVMCAGASIELAIDLVVFGLRAPADGGSGRVEATESVESKMPRVVGGVRSAECRALFERWLLRDGRNRAQEPYVRQLLELTQRRPDTR
ncbi:MAG TPA: HAD-IA family hydrolase [Byssovorax sp.]